MVGRSWSSSRVAAATLGLSALVAFCWFGVPFGWSLFASGLIGGAVLFLRFVARDLRRDYVKPPPPIEVGDEPIILPPERHPQSYHNLPRRIL
jgi:hypothetical protein